MALESGTRLGHYEIADKIGQGGMGEVYRAHDTRLGRDVAIKVLPSELARDEDRLARLEREARLLAALNHPNIASIYGLEEHGDSRFLVLELVEGDTLADRLKRGPIPVEESLQLALQIAEALEAAHEKGVIHRDLKPANIKITPEDRVKVLDFGLARAFFDDATDVSLSNSPTLSMQATKQGVLLGTLAYMSPEQAGGERPDRRTDVWSFGVVLFEMLAGSPPFAGETPTHILASILKADPDWNRLPAALHSRIRRLVQRCLERSIRNRYHSMADVRIEIRSWLDRGLDENESTDQPSGRKAFSRAWAALVVGLVLLAGLIVGSTWRSSSREIFKLDITLPPGLHLVDTGRAIALSPDGSAIVIAAFGNEGPSRLYVRELHDDFQWRTLGGTEGAISPFFSPEGNRLAYFADDALYVTQLDVGTPQRLSPSVGASFYGSWGSDGTILLAGRITGVQRLRADAIDAEPEVVVPSGRTVNSVQLLDDGTILFSEVTRDGDFVKILAPGAEDVQTLVQGDGARYAFGYLMYLSEGALYAAPYDIGRREMTRAGTPLVDGVNLQRGAEGVRMDISEDGTLAYVPQSRRDVLSLVEVDSSGNETRLLNRAGAYPRFSPNGSWLAFARGIGGSVDIWIQDMDRGGVEQNLTLDGGLNIAPVWHPTGLGLAFASDAEGLFSPYWVAVDGSDRRRLVSEAEQNLFPVSWHPNGRVLALLDTVTTASEDLDILLFDTEAQEIKGRLNEPGVSEGSPAFSADGNWLAYAADRDEPGRSDIYVTPYPALRPRTRISDDGGAEPVWSPCVNTLFYRNGREMLEVTLGPDGSPGTPEVLFQGSFALRSEVNAATQQYDVLPDCRSFAMVEYGDEAEPIRIVLNWEQELLERVPAD